MRSAAGLEIDLSPFPALKKWADEIGTREAVKKGANVPDTGRTDADRMEFFKNARARIDAMVNEDKH